METKHIWVLTNDKGTFIEACETREKALAEMENWRNSCKRTGIFNNVSKVSSVLFERISFEITHRNGKVEEMKAQRTMLH